MRISDWSSGVCSSDLIGVRPGRRADDVEGVVDVRHPMAQRIVHRVLQRLRSRNDRDHLRAQQIGRASCKERVCQYVYISVSAVSLKQKIINLTTHTITNKPKCHAESQHPSDKD